MQMSRRNVLKGLGTLFSAAVLPGEFWFRQRAAGAVITAERPPFQGIHDIADAIVDDSNKFVLPKLDKGFETSLLQQAGTFGYRRGAVSAEDSLIPGLQTNRFLRSAHLPQGGVGCPGDEFRSEGIIYPDHTDIWVVEKYHEPLSSWEELIEELLRQIWDGFGPDGPMLDILIDGDSCHHIMLRYTAASTSFAGRRCFRPQFERDGFILVVDVEHIRQVIVHARTARVPFKQRMETSRFSRNSSVHYLEDDRTLDLR